MFSFLTRGRGRPGGGRGWLKAGWTTANTVDNGECNRPSINCYSHSESSPLNKLFASTIGGDRLGCCITCKKNSFDVQRYFFETLASVVIPKQHKRLVAPVPSLLFNNILNIEHHEKQQMNKCINITPKKHNTVTQFKPSISNAIRFGRCPAHTGGVPEQHRRATVSSQDLVPGFLQGRRNCQDP